MPARAGRSEEGCGEAASGPLSDGAVRPRREPGNTGPGLLLAALARGKLQRAWNRVRANKGAAGIDGLDIERRPLSPPLANVLPDEVDKELERRGHCFARYADDANVYVRSRKAGERVMALLRRLYGKLRLTVNETKSAVAGVFGRKFLGYAFSVAPGGAIKRKVAAKPMAMFRRRIRQLTRRSGGRGMHDVVAQLRSYVLGRKAYFRLAQTPRVWRDLDQWMRHRLRAIQLKQWKRGKTI